MAADASLQVSEFIGWIFILKVYRLSEDNSPDHPDYFSMPAPSSTQRNPWLPLL